MRKFGASIIALMLALSMLLTSCSLLPSESGGESGGGSGGESSGESGDEQYLQQIPTNLSIRGEKIPAFSGSGYYAVNGNLPFFTSEEITDVGYYEYSELDSLGRSGVAIGCIGPETLPTDTREKVYHIRPSGWEYNGKSNNNSYPAILGGQTIFNRSHLLANQLVSEDVDVRNFITGTKFLNQDVMKDFENMVADFVKGGYGHVMYRVTPMFEGDNLICSGVLMEGYSVEDEGEAITFCVFIYNVQPGIEINYLTGENRLPSSDNDNTGDGSGDNVGDGEGDDITDSALFPMENVGYHLYANADGKSYYFSGDIKSKALTATTEKDKAVKVYFESAGEVGSYYIYVMDGTNKSYLNMTSNTTKAMNTVQNSADATTWVLKVDTMQIYNGTYSDRAFSLYAASSDIRTYATKANGAIWVWFSAAE